MSTKSNIALSIAVIVGVLCPGFLALAGERDDFEDRGGYVMPCSLDGVNPVYHRDIFGNPAVARSWGFVEGRDHTWHVLSNCSGWPR
jgi:hypothetical protein